MAAQLPILVAEDEETDAMLLRMALKKAGFSNPLVLARDGQEAVDYLGHADRATHPIPSLLLLDIKMPRMNGFDVLDWLATRPEFNQLPKIILSSSSREEDVERAHQMGVRDYLVKPSGFEELVHMMERLHSRCIDNAAQPQPAAGN